MGGCFMLLAMATMRVSSVVVEIFNTRAVLRIPNPSLGKRIICRLMVGWQAL
jgi:hypothetical protein